MIYQFEHEEIKACVGCPFSLYETDHMDVFVSCNLLKTIVWTNACENKDISPRCPLVAISKTETVRKMTVDIQLRPLLDDMEVDIDQVKEIIESLKGDQQ